MSVPVYCLVASHLAGDQRADAFVARSVHKRLCRRERLLRDVVGNRLGSQVS